MKCVCLALLTAFLGTECAAGDWPQILGPTRNGHADGERRRNGRVDGIATGAQNGHARLAGERVGGRHDPVRRLDTVLPISGALRAERHDRCRTDRGERGYPAVANGCVSVTPLQVDLTRHAALADVQEWLRGRGP